MGGGDIVAVFLVDRQHLLIALIGVDDVGQVGAGDERADRDLSYVSAPR